MEISILYYTEIRWMNMDKLLKRFFWIQERNTNFQTSPFSPTSNKYWRLSGEIKWNYLICNSIMCSKIALTLIMLSDCITIFHFQLIKNLENLVNRRDHISHLLEIRCLTLLHKHINSHLFNKINFAGSNHGREIIQLR